MGPASGPRVGPDQALATAQQPTYRPTRAPTCGPTRAPPPSFLVASGMQNAMTTTYGGAVVRTTHVTGSITDIGVCA